MTIDLHNITDYVAYWVLFWSIVNVALPPREVFADSSDITKRRYNTLLMLVAYYGSLNLRKVTTGLYEAVQQKEVATAETIQAGQIAQAKPGYKPPPVPPSATVIPETVAPATETKP